MRYESVDADGFGPSKDLWLNRWLPIATEQQTDQSILELGCGVGWDTRHLLERGYCVTAVDKSVEALSNCQIIAPKANHLLIDLREKLPFIDCNFEVIIASLCLHYFEWDKTVEIVSEINRCLSDKGTLLARLNSTNDVNHGAVGYRAVGKNAYIVNDEYKRFFDEELIFLLFENGWKNRDIEEMSISRYSKPKVVWEVILEKESVREA